MAFYNAPKCQGEPSDHFDGERFHNLESTEHGSFGDLMKWMRTREKGAWTHVDALPGPPPPTAVASDTLRVTLVGHATLLVQMDGLNLLTDPVWEERCSPVQFAGPKRFRPPALRMEDLPPIHLVLISHNHYDHLCVNTLRALREKHDFEVVTGLGNRALFHKEGIGDAQELDWWDKTHAAGVEVHCVPMKHFSGRGPGDRDRSLWCGLTVRHAAGDVLFAGDSGYGTHFRSIKERIGPPRAALLPIGAYRPEWFMSRVHVSPAEAVQAHLDLGATTSVGMHYGTFALADDGQHEPEEALLAARQEAGLDASDFRILDHGMGAELP